MHFLTTVQMMFTLLLALVSLVSTLSGVLGAGEVGEVHVATDTTLEQQLASSAYALLAFCALS